ncbi:hypothetical protein BBJ28_00025423 [Nothophytophthora sp. Chile5]|nr:hypothetical protein BBJ28_00025423 [Nothophytophthora sp. Chile5]
MRMQMSPSPALGGAEPVVYAPKAPTGGVSSGFAPYRRAPQEDAPFDSRSPALAHLPHVHPPAYQPQSWAVNDATPRPEDDDLQQRDLSVTDDLQSGDEASAKHSAKPAKRDVFVCPEVHCGKQFPRSFALRRHMRIHTGNKPYACDFQGCTQRFNTSGNLSRHKRIHSGERPYPCVFETCGKRFNTSTKLKRHMRIHFPDGQNLFRCVEQTCSWACDNYKEYVQHQKLHSSVAHGFDGTNENVNDSNGPNKRSKAKKSSRVMPAPMKLEAPARHVEFPGSPRALQQVQQPTASDEFYQQQDRSRMYGFSGAPSALMMMQKDQQQSPLQQQREEEDYRRLSAGSTKSFLDERSQMPSAPRLPFPTRAFPSESMVMPSSGLLGSSFHHLSHMASSSSYRSNPGYFDPAATSGPGDLTASSSSYASAGSYGPAAGSYSSYLRGGEANALASSYQTTPTTSSYMSTSEHQYSQSLRQEDVERSYQNTSPHGMRAPQQPSHHQQTQGYGSGNPVAPEFTGEELSAVLELMKDS